MGLTDTMPIYVTRKDTDGKTGTVSLSIWMVLMALLAVWLNVILWSIVGAVEAVKFLLSLLL